MFGAYTRNFKLGKYTAGSRPVDPVADWTENFYIIDETMWNNASQISTIENQVSNLLSSVEEQHTLIDGINTRVGTTATKMSQINVDLSDTRVKISQAQNISLGALTTAENASVVASQAQSAANAALSLTSQNTTNIANLRARVLQLEHEQEDN